MANRKQPDESNSPESHANGSDTAVARRRRDEIIQSATEIIATEGLHKLTLGRIERLVDMSRGQLTYYFPTKEAILLAVFDRMLGRMIEEAMADAKVQRIPTHSSVAWEYLRHGLTRMLITDHPKPKGSELGPLVHTFMAQVQHREDYRQKLAEANAGWRDHISGDLQKSLPSDNPLPPTAIASVIMALFQGLSGQLSVDPNAFDRHAVLQVCLQLLSPLMNRTPPKPMTGEADE